MAQAASRTAATATATRIQLRRKKDAAMVHPGEAWPHLRAEPAAAEIAARSGSEPVRDPQVDVAIDPGPGRGWMLELRALAEACFHRGLRQELPLVPDLRRAVVGAIVRREQPAGIGPADGHADVMLRRKVVDAGLH